MSRFPIFIGALAAVLLTVACDVTASAREEAAGTPAAEATSALPVTVAGAVASAQAGGDGPAPGTTPAPAVPSADEAEAGVSDASVPAGHVAAEHDADADGEGSLEASVEASVEGSVDGSVEGRAQARWDALIAGDYEAAYDLYSPGFREAVTFEAFRAQQHLRTVEWIEARVVGATCEEEDACEVRSTVTYGTNRPMRGVSRIESATSVTERWVRLGGAWYFVPDRLG